MSRLVLILVVGHFGAFLIPQGSAPSNVGVSSSAPCRIGNLNNEPPSDGRAIALFFEALKTAIRQDDRNQVAAMMSYPLLTADGKSKRTIRSKAQFLAEYDRAFPVPVRQFLERQKPECVSRVGAQGFSVGTGEIWFDFFPNGKIKIFTINPVMEIEQH